MSGGALKPPAEGRALCTPQNYVGVVKKGALPPPNTYGPLPMNLYLGPGTASKEEMLAGMERGIWVTRFHYIRHLHPLTVTVTGMTGDGAFLVERGEITRPIKKDRAGDPAGGGLLHL